MKRAPTYLAAAMFLAAVVALPTMAAYDDPVYDYDQGMDWSDYEWDPTWGIHEEEWYDPSDWFDDDEGVEYEDYGWLGTDDYGYGYNDYYDYGYGYDLYDDDYGYDYDYYTDDWYETDDTFGDWYDEEL